MYGFPLAISCCVKISNIPSKFVKYIDVPLFKAVTLIRQAFLVKRFFVGGPPNILGENSFLNASPYCLLSS